LVKWDPALTLPALPNPETCEQLVTGTGGWVGVGVAGDPPVVDVGLDVEDCSAVDVGFVPRLQALSVMTNVKTTRKRKPNEKLPAWCGPCCGPWRMIWLLFSQLAWR
jgi:hypothetical protein